MVNSQLSLIEIEKKGPHFMTFLWWLENQTAHFFPPGAPDLLPCAPSTPILNQTHPPLAHQSLCFSPLVPPGRRNKDNNWLQFIFDCIVCYPFVAGSNSLKRLLVNQEPVSSSVKHPSQACGTLGQAAGVPSGVGREMSRNRHGGIEFEWLVIGVRWRCFRKINMVWKKI